MTKHLSIVLFKSNHSNCQNSILLLGRMAPSLFLRLRRTLASDHPPRRMICLRCAWHRPQWGPSTGTD